MMSTGKTTMELVTAAAITPPSEVHSFLTKVKYIVRDSFLNDPCKCYHCQKKSICETLPCTAVPGWK